VIVSERLNLNIGRRLTTCFTSTPLCNPSCPTFYPDSSCWTYLPLAVDANRYRPLATPTQHHALIFVGNVSPNRAALLQQIEDRLPLVVRGPNSSGKRFNRRQKLDSAAINSLYNQHHMVLNINQAPNTEHGANLRTFEVPAAGAVLLTQHSRDLDALYEPGHEVLSYTSSEQLVDTYQRATADPQPLATIAAAGLKRTLAQHTFTHRAAALLRALA